MTRRRAFLAGAVTLLAAPFAAIAQPAGRGFRVGVLIHGAPQDWSDSVAALKQRLRELGYVEGANVTFEMRWSQGDRNDLPRLAADLVHGGVDLIVTMTTPAALAATRATSTIPIVMCGVAQPVELGLVPSLAHPGAMRRAIRIIPGRVPDQAAPASQRSRPQDFQGRRAASGRESRFEHPRSGGN